MKYSGQCLCGAVCYSCTTEPVFAGNCHCSDCKKSSGSGYFPTMFFPEDSVSISGEVTYFESPGGSGKMVARGFCSTCGSQILGKPGAWPGVVAIRAGSLDDISAYEPQIDIFTRHAAPWDAMDQNLPKASEMPSRE